MDQGLESDLLLERMLVLGLDLAQTQNSALMLDLDLARGQMLVRVQILVLVQEVALVQFQILELGLTQIQKLNQILKQAPAER